LLVAGQLAMSGSIRNLLHIVERRSSSNGKDRRLNHRPSPLFEPPANFVEQKLAFATASAAALGVHNRF
jgi:hypothetical protein